MIEQLQALCMLTWDGNLLSKQYRDDLVEAGLAQRFEGGFNLITPKGVQYLYDLRLLPKRLSGAVKP
jgi:hypothetical protein